MPCGSSEVRFLIDRCARFRLAQWLRDQGHDVVESRERGPDPGDRQVIIEAKITEDDGTAHRGEVTRIGEPPAITKALPGPFPLERPDGPVSKDMLR
jgi:predicted nuclease of predicted toxin-antitoxin system